jgi:aspartate/methionine/tyrosine aminotransferase
MSEILSLLGAGGGLFSIIHAFMKKGDEILIIEPCFPRYYDIAYLIEGITVRTVPLNLVKEEDNFIWKLDMNSFREAINDKTKLFILNNPNNPTGKVFSRDELESISSILDYYP